MENLVANLIPFSLTDSNWLAPGSASAWERPTRPSGFLQTLEPRWRRILRRRKTSLRQQSCLLHVVPRYGSHVQIGIPRKVCTGDFTSRENLGWYIQADGNNPPSKQQELGSWVFDTFYKCFPSRHTPIETQVWVQVGPKKSLCTYVRYQHLQWFARFEYIWSSRAIMDRCLSPSAPKSDAIDLWHLCMNIHY